MAGSTDESTLNLKGGGDLAETSLERMQVKYVASDGAVIKLKCFSHSLTNGKVRRTKRYTAASIDILAVYDATSSRCYYVPASALGDGRSSIFLRLTPSLNGQRDRIHMAANYLDPPDARVRVEPAGIEPATS